MKTLIGILFLIQMAVAYDCNEDSLHSNGWDTIPYGSLENDKKYIALLCEGKKITNNDSYDFVLLWDHNQITHNKTGFVILFFIIFVGAK